MISYRAIITYFEAICDQHQQIQSFTYGERNFVDIDKYTKYPALHLTPTGTAIDEQTVTYGFDVVVFDRYDVANNKMKNEAVCLSDSLLILQDICAEITDGKYFINEDTLISMELPVICQPFIDTDPDNCSGWFTSFNVITPNEVTACNIPYPNTEVWKGIDIILPDGVEKNNSAWFSCLDLFAKISQDANRQVTSFAPIYDTMNGLNTLTLNGQSVEYDRVRNSLHFTDITSTGNAYLESPILNTSNLTFFITIKDFSRFGTTADGLTNGSNILMSFENDNEDDVTLSISKTTGLLGLTESTSVFSDYEVTPMNGDSHATAHRRYKPLTIAITFNSSGKIVMYYSDDITTKKEIQTGGFELSDGKFFIGAKTNSFLCDFYLKEFFFTESVMSNTNIVKTMEWLNYR